MKIIAENLGKRFNREWVFRNLNYQFDSGNIYAITGPNGSGKSTLMQVLWGQMQPSAGSLNYSIPNAADIFKSIAIATPYMELIDEFTLVEMIQFHFKFKGCRLSPEEIIELSGLSSSQQKTVATFSSGMRQRLKLLLAFYSDTEILFLDEPCTNLDRKSIDWYHDQLQRVKSETLIFIASNQEIEYPSISIKIDISSYK